MKKSKIDYIISKDGSDKLIFRFDLEGSRVHGFHDEPPKTWAAVYKVYFSYSIIETYDIGDGLEYEVVYEESFDECSCLDQVSYQLKELAVSKEVGKKYYLRPFGNGTHYELELFKNYNNKKYCTITMIQNGRGKAYRFTLSQKRLMSFAKAIDLFLEKALENSEGI